jgi:hypothetical protein
LTGGVPLYSAGIAPPVGDGFLNTLNGAAGGDSSAFRAEFAALCLERLTT